MCLLDFVDAINLTIENVQRILVAIQSLDTSYLLNLSQTSGNFFLKAKVECEICDLT